MKLKKGDNVIIISGKDKGKKGKIIKSIPKNNKVIVEGLNVFKKHQKPRRSGEKGSVVDVAMPINVSNVMFFDSKISKRTRLGKKKIGDTLARVSKKSGQEV